jgi:hypothetical protein
LQGGSYQGVEKASSMLFQATCAAQVRKGGHGKSIAYRV